MTLKAIFAVDEMGGFGKDKGLPWPNIKQDLQNFKKQTHGNYIVMGRATYMSLPTLPYRIPIVVSDNEKLDVHGGVRVSRERFTNNIKDFSAFADNRDVFIIGGSSLLTEESLNKCEEIHLTRVKGVFDADVFLDLEAINRVLENFKLENEEVLDNCTIQKYVKN